MKEEQNIVERILFRRLEVWLVALFCLVSLVLGGLWAWGVARHDVFPAGTLKEIARVVRGTDGDNRSFLIGCALATGILRASMRLSG